MQRRARRRHLVLRCIAGLVSCLFGWGVARSDAKENIDAQAVHRKPFGVGRMRVDFASGQSPKLVQDHQLWFTDAEGRTHYPAFQVEKPFFYAPQEDRTVDSVTVLFLFRGDQPLDLTLDVDLSHTTRVVPGDDAGLHTRLLNEWWRTYTRSATARSQVESYLPDIENYLVATLGRRLELQVPVRKRVWSGREDIDSIFGTLLGAESIRLAMQQDTLLQPGGTVEKPDKPLPVAAAPPPVTLPALPEEIDIEPIALHVPAECFYVRCGSFSNFQWLRNTLDDWGGDLRILVADRGVDYQIRPRLERQLALRETALARLLGSTVIADLAFIGTDTFFREGAAVGVLFQARSNRLLAAQISAQRSAALEADPAATEQTVDVAGRQVSLLSTPDHAVRSFYAVDGDFHLVTTSQTLVRRFFEAGAGQDVLGSLPEFRHARNVMPLSKGYAAFVYLSDPFFRMFISPQYRIEMTRRMRAQADLGLVELARLAAAAEQQPAETVEQLIAGGFLPAGFGQRSDGSRPILQAGHLSDSLRGGRTSFLPVPDIELTNCTTSEAIAYDQFRMMYQRQWQRMDPVIVGIQREPLPGPAEPRERIVLDVQITPYARQHYAFLAAMLRAPDTVQMLPVPGNVLEFDLVYQSFSKRFTDTRHLAFGGLRDAAPDFSIRGAELIVTPPLGTLRLPFYLGDVIPTGLMDLVAPVREPDAEGYARNPDNSIFIWQRQLETMRIAAKDKRVLEEISPHLKVAAAERPAQLRLSVGDLQHTRWARLLEAAAYCRARVTSAGNAQFLNELMRQLRVKPDDCTAAAEAVLAAKLACPLGGEFKPHLYGPGPVHWKSSAWVTRSLANEDSLPASYHSPLLEWFHGLKLEFSIGASTLATRIELELQPRSAPEK